MPELPEVETVMRGMAPHMTGRTIKTCTTRRANLRMPFPQTITTALNGAYIERLRRRSKYILFDIQSPDEGDVVMLLHLGMSGHIRIMTDPTEITAHNNAPGKHDHIEWVMADTNSHIVFTDPRRFGIVTMFGAQQEADHPLLKSIGVEPFSNDFHEEYLLNAMQRSKSPMKTFLLNQKIIAGLGNIYVCESLWRAGIHPTTRACDVPQDHARPLYRHILTILQEAIDSGGSSLKDHRQTNGKLGYFQHNFAVYGREDEACRATNCDAAIERIVQSGRSSFYCPTCQIAPQ